MTTPTRPGLNDESVSPGDSLLPRRLWRHLVTTAELRLRSRIFVAGDGAEHVASVLCGLGADATSQSEATLLPDGACDAVLWLELGRSGDDHRSLQCVDALQRTSRLIRSVTPGGVFQFVCLVDGSGGSHEIHCVENHFLTLGETPRISIFPERAAGGFFLGSVRRTYAVATCRSADRALPARTAAVETAFQLDDSCCRWADRSRAA